MYAFHQRVFRCFIITFLTRVQTFDTYLCGVQSNVSALFKSQAADDDDDDGDDDDDDSRRTRQSATTPSILKQFSNNFKDAAKDSAKDFAKGAAKDAAKTTFSNFANNVFSGASKNVIPDFAGKEALQSSTDVAAVPDNLDYNAANSVTQGRLAAAGEC